VCRVRLRRAVERGLCEHAQPYICAVSDDGGLLPRLYRGALGNEGVCSVGFWEGTLVLFLGRWYREWEEKARYVHSMSHPQTDQIYVDVPRTGTTVVFGYIEGSFLVNKSDDTRERYVPNTCRFIRT